MDPTTDWPEILALFFLGTGIVFALASNSPATLYTVCFLMGLIFGRMWHKMKKNQCIPLSMIIMAFFLGYVLGGIWANLRIIAIMLLAGILTGYWIHEKKILRTW